MRICWAKSKREEKEEVRFHELGRILEERIPPTPSKLVERRAQELLEGLQSPDAGIIQAAVRERMAAGKKQGSAR